MKRVLLGLSALAFSTLLSAQTNLQRQNITRNYDAVKLQQLSQKFQLTKTARKEAAIKMAAEKGWDLFITNPNGSVDELMDVSPDGQPIYYTIENVDAAISTRTNYLNIGGSLGLNLDGQNMVANVWDGGATRRTHQEFDGPGGINRVTIIDGVTSTNSNSFHSQHVTGTIMASGFVSASKGMAPRAQARTADWNNDLSEAATEAANGMLISNHSYGFQGATIPDYYFGAYIQESRDWDEIMHASPYYLMVVAAGNDGNDNTMNLTPIDGNSSYDKLSGHSTSKNNLVVANANDANINPDGSLNSVVINNSSSEGPTDDYRIKPDITGNGTGLYSTDADNDSDYTTLTGTSMASPNVTGSLLLLQEYYNSLNGNFMRAATLKGLALHTADDAGPTGPDAVYGWGLLNVKAAAEAITSAGNGSIVDELTLLPGQSYTISVNSNEVDPIIASISWTDVPGTATTQTNNSTPVLVNDLDIRVVKNSTTYLPYKLTGVNSNALGDNNVDPFERIAVANATGTYTITVSHKGSLSGGSQAFTLIVTGISSEPVVCNADVPTNLNVTNVQSNSASLNWNAVTAASYDFRYRKVGTTTWNTIAISSNSYSITGLTPETQYEAQVRSKCDDGANSAFSASVLFTTPEIQLNYCASKGNNSSDEHIKTIAIGSFSKTSGNNGGYADFTSDVILVTKDQATTFTLTPGFSGTAYNETWRLFADLNKDGDFTDTGELLYTSSNTNSAVSGSITIPGSAITGNTRMRVSMKYNGSATACESFSYGEVEDYTLQIQEGTVEPCDAPLGLAATNPTTSSIDVAWNSVSNANSYNLQYRSGSTWNTLSVASTSITVSGLADNTTYEFRVASDCGNLESDYSAVVTAATEEEIPVCDAPTNLQSSNIGHTSFDISWTAASDAVNYNVEIRPAGGSWTTQSTSATTYSFSSLAPNTAYEVRVQTICASLNSSYSNSISVTTNEEPSNLQYCASKGNNSSDEHINTVAIGSFSKTSGNNGGYADFTSDVISITKDQATSFTLTPGFSGTTYNETWRLFADLNKDGDFTDAGELLYTSANTRSAVSGSITIPASAITGNTRLRVSMKYNGSATACESFSYGEVEDYTLQINEGTVGPCDAPTNLQSSNIGHSSFDISWSAASDAVNYNVEIRPTGGAWTSQSTSATTYSFTGLAPSTSYEVRVLTICSSLNSSYSNSISATTNEEPVIVEYCDASGNSSSDEWIQYVRFGSNTYSSGNNGGYLDNTSKVINMTPGGSIYMELDPGFTTWLWITNSYPEYWNVYIDFNKDGDFDDAGELFATSNGTSTGTISGTVSIPEGLSGTTRMRVTMRRNNGAAGCGNFDLGEVEDYTVDFGAASSSRENSFVTNSTHTPVILRSNISFDVAPNPTADNATVRFEMNPKYGESTLKVVDVTGRIVSVTSLTAVTYETEQTTIINLENQPAGAYLIILETESGERAANRLIKK